MRGSSVSAPGKAVLCGEYAVLRGAVAIAMAIDKRARVHLVQTDNDCHSVAMPGYAAGSWRFRSDSAGKVEWLDATARPDMRLVEAALATVQEPLPPATAVTIDTRDFFETSSGKKLGFGSSAAAAVALVAALQRAPANDGCKIARQIHRTLQGGRGSGVDVAASCCGGVIRFRTDDSDAPGQLSWPDGLLFRFLWSGRPADTNVSIRQLENSRQDEGSWRALVAAANAAAEIFPAGQADSIIDSLRCYTQVLKQFSVDHDLGIFDAGHAAMVNAADARGVLYKPCGAGGGDIGIVISTDAAKILQFCNDARKKGFMPLDVNLAHRGVAEETDNGLA